MSFPRQYSSYTPNNPYNITDNHNHPSNVNIYRSSSQMYTPGSHAENQRQCTPCSYVPPPINYDRCNNQVSCPPCSPRPKVLSQSSFKSAQQPTTSTMNFSALPVQQQASPSPGEYARRVTYERLDIPANNYSMPPAVPPQTRSAGPSAARCYYAVSAGGSPPSFQATISQTMRSRGANPGYASNVTPKSSRPNGCVPCQLSPQMSGGYNANQAYATCATPEQRYLSKGSVQCRPPLRVSEEKFSKQAYATSTPLKPSKPIKRVAKRSLPETRSNNDESDYSPACSQLTQRTTDYLNSLRSTVISAIVRRKRLSNAWKQVESKTDCMDCKERRTQKLAIRQMESNLRMEVFGIYNSLMQQRKRIIQELRSSSFTSDAIGTKSVAFATSRSNLSEEEYEMAEEFVKMVIDLIEKFATKEFEMFQALCSCAGSNADENSQLQEYMKATDSMQEAFIKFWERFEKVKCTCTNDDEADVLGEMGMTLREFLVKQSKLSASLERKLDDVCQACQTDTEKTFPNLDRLEMSGIHVDVMNDLWSAMEAAKQQLDERPTKAHANNYGTIFRALLALCRMCYNQVESMLEEHFRKRRLDQAETSDSTFDDEWAKLRADNNCEMKAIVDSINPTVSHMNCVERTLKSLQQKECQKIIEKHTKNSQAAKCTQCSSVMLEKELASLSRKHDEQWDIILMKKFERKANDLDNLSPKEDATSCVQTTPTLSSCNPEESASTSSEATSCTQKEDKPDTKIDVETDQPNLSELALIEVNEMRELQRNLRQWQQARRSLLESINTGLSSTNQCV